jgi:hypothetical protein
MSTTAIHKYKIPILDLSYMRVKERRLQSLELFENRLRIMVDFDCDELKGGEDADEGDDKIFKEEEWASRRQFQEWNLDKMALDLLVKSWWSKEEKWVLWIYHNGATSAIELYFNSEETIDKIHQAVKKWRWE